MKIKNLNLTVLYSNAVQVLLMFLMSVVVPFYIGLERYGKFVIIFSLPATASVFLQSFYLENANRFGINRVLSISLGLGFICTFIIFLIQCLHLELINASLQL